MPGAGGFRRRVYLLFCLMAVSTTSCQTASHQTYEPGTIGYLVEDCREAVKANTVTKFYDSWCAPFLHGFVGGTLAAAMKNHRNFDFPEISENCEEVVSKETDRIRKRTLFCMGGLLPSVSILTTAQVVAKWGSWLKRNDPAMLSRSVVPHFNEVNRPGAFCDYVQNWGLRKEVLIVNPFLKKLTEKQWQRRASLLGEISTEEDLRKCYEKTPYSEMESAQFLETRCGRISAGILTGIYVTDIPPLPQAANPHCAADIDRVRRHLITARDACLPNNVPPEDIRSVLINLDLCNMDRKND